MNHGPEVRMQTGPSGQSLLQQAPADIHAVDSRAALGGERRKACCRICGWQSRFSLSARLPACLVCRLLVAGGIRHRCPLRRTYIMKGAGHRQDGTLSAHQPGGLRPSQDGKLVPNAPSALIGPATTGLLRVLTACRFRWRVVGSGGRLPGPASWTDTP